MRLPRSARVSCAPAASAGIGLAQPAEHGGGQVGQHHQARLPGGGGVEQAGPVAGAADQGELQVRRLGDRAGRGDQERRAGREFGRDAGEFGVRRGEHRGPFGRSDGAQVHHGQRAAGQHPRGQVRRRGQVGGDAAGRVGERERGARADGGGAARRGPRQQAPVRVVLRVAGHQRAHGRHHRARSCGLHRGKRPAGGVGVAGLRPGARVQREPAVGRAGQRQHRVVHQRPDRALAGQPPQRRRGGRGHVAPPQPGQADHDHVPRGRRGLRASRLGCRDHGQGREQAGEQPRPHRTRPHRHRPTVSGIKRWYRTDRVARPPDRSRPR